MRYETEELASGLTAIIFGSALIIGFGYGGVPALVGISCIVMGLLLIVGSL